MVSNITIAKLCHEINKIYCESMGDLSQIKWEEAPKWQRTSAMHGVRFYMDNPNATPKDMHDSWLKEKLDNGWTYGPLKDSERKTHPCIMEYEKLPESQKIKDRLFLTVVKSLTDYANR